MKRTLSKNKNKLGLAQNNVLKYFACYIWTLSRISHVFHEDGRNLKKKLCVLESCCLLRVLYAPPRRLSSWCSIELTPLSCTLARQFANLVFGANIHEPIVIYVTRILKTATTTKQQKSAHSISQGLGEPVVFPYTHFRNDTTYNPGSLSNVI